MIEEALRLSVYFGESSMAGSRPAHDVLFERLAAHGIATAALLRGLEGFGMSRRMRAGRFPDVSSDLPLLAVAIGGHDRVRGALEDVDRTVPRGLLTLEPVRLVTGDDVRDAEFPEGVGAAARLTVYCGARERAGPRPAFRAVVALLRRHGATGAIVLAGVDGLLRERRERATLWSAGANVPMVISSVGPTDLLMRSLRHLREVLDDPVVTLERVAQTKHDGELLEPLPEGPRMEAGGDVWQAVSVYTRRSAVVSGGSALYGELGRRLREAGGAGVTTVLGDWGFSSDEAPHGDRLWRVTSHRPTYTVFIDRPAGVRRLWPLIDDLTVAHGIVTSSFVPAYLERADGTAHGSLDIAEEQIRSLVGAQGATRAPAEPVPVAAAGEPEWLADLRRRAVVFASSRGGHAPVVRVSLADGERFYLASARPGPGPDFVTLVPHPERYDEMLPGEREPLAPRAVIVPNRSIVKLELLPRAPRGARSLVTFDPAPGDGP